MSTAVIDQFATDNEDAVNVQGVDQSSPTCLGNDLSTVHLTQKVHWYILCITFSQ